MLRWLLFGWLCVVLLVAQGCPAPNTTPPQTGCGQCPANAECVDGQYCLTKCPTGTTRCGLDCVDLQANFLNCGKCGITCGANEACIKGTCQLSASKCVPVCQGGKICAPNGRCICARGETDCNGSCFQLQASALHCGRCGNACPTGTACEKGACVCQSGLTLCAGTCLDTTSHPQHCGACNNACPADRFCDQGTCACKSGKTDCSGACVDTQSDAAHCGACGTTCKARQVCTNGSCFCPRDEALCGDTCANLKQSDAHCGACGTACKADESCINGQCIAFQKCTNGTVSCAGLCVDVKTNTRHCGSCQTLCRPEQDCVAGVCKVLTCQANEARCNGRCIDPLANASHCGACNRACRFNERCSRGRCVPICEQDKTLCDVTCRDTKTDVKHCGACGKACLVSEFCQDGKCVSYCKNGLQACGDGCVDLNTQLKNCGACGTDCDVCDKGVCLCRAGRINCNNKCTNNMTDKNHCGSCGNVCQNLETCEQGVCKVTTAKFYIDADKDGFGDKNATPIVANVKTPPAGDYVTNNLDCCDKDDKANPNQKGFFETANKCGSFDYNCDGKSTSEVPLCACSKTVSFASTVKYVLTSDNVQAGVRQVTLKDIPLATNTAAMTNTTCEMLPRKVQFPGVPANKGSSTHYVTQYCGNCTSGYDFPTSAMPAFSGDFPRPGGKGYIMWDKNEHKNACAFYMNGTRPKCGDKNALEAGSLQTDLLSYNQETGVGWWMKVNVGCCGNTHGRGRVFRRGAYSTAAAFGVSPQTGKTIPTVKCQ